MAALPASASRHPDRVHRRPRRLPAENGATRVVPGSHRWDRGRHPQPDEIVDAVVPGGAVIYLGSTIHFAGTNSTVDEWRRGLHISYTLGWLRTEENNSLGCRPRSRAPHARSAGTPRLRGARRHRRRRRLPRHGEHARPDGAPGVGRPRVDPTWAASRGSPPACAVCRRDRGADYPRNFFSTGYVLVLQPYGATTEFAVPSLNTMAPHDGMGITWESGYFVGTGQPLDLEGHRGRRFLDRLGRRVRARLLQRLDEEVGRTGNRQPLRT